MRTHPQRPGDRRSAAWRWALPALVALGCLMGASAQAVRFEVSASGTEVTDTLTGLTWRRCAEGASWDGSTCAGTTVDYNWTAALQRTQSEAQSSGVSWRLPNVKELDSLVDASRAGPAIDVAAFPNTASDCFWSSTWLPGFEGEIWMVYFSDGNSGFLNFHSGCAIRLVRKAK